MADIQVLPAGGLTGYTTMMNAMSPAINNTARTAALLQDQPYIRAQQAAQTQGQNLTNQYMPLTMQNATYGSPFQQQQLGVQQQQFGSEQTLRQQELQRQYALLQSQINQQQIGNKMAYQKMIYDQYGPKQIPGLGFAFPPGSPLDPANQQGGGQNGAIPQDGAPQGPTSATPGQPMPQGAGGPQPLPMPGGSQPMPQPQQAQQPNPMQQQQPGAGSVYPIPGIVSPAFKPAMQLTDARTAELKPVVDLNSQLARVQMLLNVGTPAAHAQVQQLLTNLFDPSRVSSPLMENNENYGTLYGRAANILSKTFTGQYSEDNVKQIQGLVDSAHDQVTTPALNTINAKYRNMAAAARIPTNLIPDAPDIYNDVKKKIAAPAPQTSPLIVGNLRFPSKAAADKYQADLAKYQASISGQQ